MKRMQFFRALSEFWAQQSGQSTVQIAAFFGALALVVALVGAPMLDKASKEYADDRSFGIDQVITGSIQKSNDKTKPPCHSEVHQ